MRFVTITSNPYQGLKLEWLYLPLPQLLGGQVTITSNPYQGLKRKYCNYSHYCYYVTITSNPYQGLKPGDLSSSSFSFRVTITSNPYQGLKPQACVVGDLPPCYNHL